MDKFKMELLGTIAKPVSLKKILIHVYSLRMVGTFKKCAGMVSGVASEIELCLSEAKI